MKNLHRRFDLYYIGKIYGGDFAKFCDLRIYELYHQSGYHRNGYYGSHLTSLQILEGNVELVSKELNHLAAILHVYAEGLIFMK